jgi:hypothetical protein
VSKTSPRKAAYLAYMRSARWRANRSAWWAEYDRRNRVRRCYCCGISWAEAKGLDVHHRTYERLGNEFYGDMVAVCRRDHMAITRIWRNRGNTGMSLSLWELTDWYRAHKRGEVSGRAPRSR